MEGSGRRDLVFIASPSAPAVPSAVPPACRSRGAARIWHRPSEERERHMWISARRGSVCVERQRPMAESARRSAGSSRGGGRRLLAAGEGGP